MSNAYFIDTENIGNKWTRLLSRFSPLDTVYVFESRNSQETPESFYQDCIAQIKHIKTTGVGHNDMDILIGGIIGTVLSKYNKFFIVSNDTGYRSFINFFRDTYGADIVRIGIPEQYTKLGKTKSSIKMLDLDDSKKKCVIRLIEKHQYDRSFKEKIYKKLCKIYGFDEGLRIYTVIKKHIV